MKAPGFTAEASVYKSAACYATGGISASAADSIEPSMVSLKSVIQGVGVGVSIGAAVGGVEGGVGALIGSAIGAVVGGIACLFFDCA